MFSMIIVILILSGCNPSKESPTPTITPSPTETMIPTINPNTGRVIGILQTNKPGIELYLMKDVPGKGIALNCNIQAVIGTDNKFTFYDVAPDDYALMSVEYDYSKTSMQNCFTAKTTGKKISIEAGKEIDVGTIVI
jgi:hypothetical protein